MASFEHIEFILPAHWAPSLINGDDTGLEDWEIRTIDQFLIDWSQGSPLIWANCSEQPDFVTYHDVRQYGIKPCDCLEYQALRQL